MRRASLLRAMTRCALMGALISVLSPLAVPLGPVPLTLMLLAVLLTAALLPALQTLGAVGLYLAVGALGLPVFAGGQGGAGVLLGPLGGYLWSLLFLAPIASYLIGILCKGRGKRAVLLCFLCLLLPTILCHLCGSVQYCLLMQTSFLSSLVVTSVPFLLPDMLKCLLVAAVAQRIPSSR